MELRNWLSDASVIVVAGIGNAIRCDDYVGVRVVEGLRGRTSQAVHLIECETVPESFVDEIVSIQPSHVLLIDAAVLGLSPGTAHLYDVEEVADVPSISTHTLPLRVFSDYVGMLTGARIALAPHRAQVHGLRGCDERGGRRGGGQGRERSSRLSSLNCAMDLRVSMSTSTYAIFLGHGLQ